MLSPPWTKKLLKKESLLDAADRQRESASTKFLLLTQSTSILTALANPCRLNRNRYRRRRVASGQTIYVYVKGNPLRYVDPTGLITNSRGPGLCSGTDCVDPSFDLTPGGGGIGPSPQPDKDKGKKKGIDCTEQPTFHACMSCCATIRGQIGSGTGIGGGCAEQCMRKEGITRADRSCPVN